MLNNQRASNRKKLKFQFVVLISMYLLLSVYFLLPGTVNASDNPVVPTVAGKIQAYFNTEHGIYTFKGIHYGESTAGEWRFRPPQAMASWEGIKEATTYGPTCPQGTGGEPGQDTVAESALQGPPISEDCLVLNVFSPDLKKKHPVMVWLHGGGFASGSGTPYDGTRLSKRGDVVVVTINHRLNVFGYLYLDEIGGDYFSGSGMAGMLDIELALKWVHDNIIAFGGDPDNVTIFGESGGGMKVSMLMAMPSSKDRFHKGIIESGPGIRGTTKEAGTRTAKALMTKLNIKDVRKLQEIPVNELLKAIAPSRGGSAMRGMGFRLSPVVDGKYLLAHPFDPVAAPTAKGIPIIIGTNKDEALFMLRRDPKRYTLTEAELIQRLKPMLGDKVNDVLSVYKRTRPKATPFDLLVAIQTEGFRLGSITLAERQGATSGAPVYMYSFDFEINEQSRAAHAVELSFVFNAATARKVSQRPETAQVETDIVESWIAFARTGDPNRPGGPHWPIYTTEHRATMVFDAVSRAINDPRRQERLAWEGIDRTRGRR